MSDHICNFCNKTFKTLAVLNNHKKNTKYCLDIQSKLKLQNTKIEEIKEENNTSADFISVSKDELELLKKEIERQNKIIEDQNKYIEELLEYKNKYDSIKETKTQHVIDAKIIKDKNDDKDTIIPLLYKDICNINSNLKLEDFRTQANSLATFYYKNILKGRIILNDKNRNIFSYKNEYENLVRDEGGNKIFYMIINASVEHFNKYTKQYLQFLDSIPRIIRNESYYELCTNLSNIVKACKSIEKKSDEYEKFKRKFMNQVKELLHFDHLASTQNIIVENKQDDYIEREDTFLVRYAMKYLPILNKYSYYVDTKAEQKGEFDDDEMFLSAVISGLEMIHKDPATKCLYNTPEFIKYFKKAIINIKPNLKEILEENYLTQQEVDILFKYI